MIAKDASLHEATVQRAAEHQATYTQPVRRPHRKAEPVVTSTYAAHPAIWQAAMKAAGGDVHRITVLSWTKVEVR